MFLDPILLAADIIWSRPGGSPDRIESILIGAIDKKDEILRHRGRNRKILAMSFENFSQREIAKKTKTYQQNISRQLKNLSQKCPK